MKFPITFKALCQPMLLAALGIGAFSWAPQVGAQPSNRPLLAAQTGAKPNLMIALDNSGSMAFNYHETYNVTNDNENVLVNGVTNFNWSAQRSANVNPLYYDPKVRYLPRVDGSGNVINPRDPRLPATVPIAERDDTYNVVWVSNQNSVNFRYTVFQRDAAPNDYRIYHSMYADNSGAPPAGSVATRNSQGHVNRFNPAGFTNRYDLPYTLRIPQHIAYTSPPAAANANRFTYAVCTNVIRNAFGQEIGCAARTLTHVNFGAAATYTIPTPNNRTDCTANVCTNAQEVANILNWYRWYSTRQLATSTAIGLALADTNANGLPNNPSTFDQELRIGYLPINDTTIPNDGNGGNTNLSLVNTPGSAASVPTVSRGVRLLQRGSATNAELFNWLYSIISRGATPLHNAINQVAKYYAAGNSALDLNPPGPVVTENAWRTIPNAAASATNQEMSCRRSFNLLFSDGGWSNAAGAVRWAPSPAGPDFDNSNGPEFSRLRADGSTETFQYLSAGINTVAGRIQYTPFPSTGTGGLADITARYFWHVDMRPGLDNNIQTRPGQPTFWQNMTTYTVGYLIRPTGEVTGTGLSFNQIDQYRTQYTLNGPGGSTVFPSFPTVNLIDDTVTNNQTRVDDFIHAGYTGGARAFSARSADDVKSIFDTIIAEILSASGRDAGVSVSSGGDSSTLAGQLKYTVSYRTMDNSGNILARALDDNGNETGVTAWSAEQLMPDAANRRVFTMHGTNQPVPFNGAFTGLPTDVQNALRQGPDAARVANDASFINYLRGDNSALDSNGRLFRQRASKIAAMVNPPSVLMGYARDYGYDDVEDGGGVDGFDSYYQFSGRKLGYPSSLFVATNAGVMHSFSAATGTEQAAFMPRRSLRRQLAFAAEPYNFEYVLDGPITQNDVFNRSFATQNALDVTEQWRAWRHLAVGTGGRGEQLIYAVNSPINPGATPNRDPDMQDFLWETGPDIVNSADGNDVTMGYIANSARSGQTEDFADQTNSQRGRWIVAVNNGHYNGVANGERAGLVVLDALTGDVIRTIPLPNGYSAGRGLSGVTLLRNYELHGRVVAAYAGDANGQLWRFNLSGEPSTWHVEHGRPLFTVPGNRPIFGHPAWQYKSGGTGGAQNGFMVVFATGIMLEEGDLDDQGPQAIYGIWDRMDTYGNMVGGPFAEVLPSELQEQEVLPSTRTDGASGSISYFGITDNPIDWNTQRGWFMRLVHAGAPVNDPRTGERSIADVINIGKSVLVTTTVLRRPASGEMCTISDLPGNYAYILNAETASARLSRSYNVTGDLRLDDFAVAYIPSGGFTRGVSAPSYQTLPDGTRRFSGVVGSPLSPSDPFIRPVIHDVSGQPTSESLLGDDGNVGLDGEDREGGLSNGSRCKNMRAIIIGTEAGSLQGGVSCPITGWSRTQFQLSGPPRN